ncbi:hypothetical protein FACS189475_03080 [Betaproteobacteria bacterium]|nr:hypothetical protein FACS189475_03080 [Betaproteobacteria bacterium]
MPESGIVTDHRFLLPAWGDGDDSLFWLTEGTYTLELVAQLAGDSFFTKLRRRFRPLSLWKVSLVLPDLIRKNTSAAIAQISHADPTVSYSWSPETDRYQIDVKTHPRSR